MVFVFVPAVSYADVVIGNDFYNDNKEKTIDIQRLFKANGSGGSVSAKDAPGSLTSVDNYKNGSMVVIGPGYKKSGKYWGMTPIGHFSWAPGWIPMDDLLMVYDAVDFANENRNRLYGFDGSLDDLMQAEQFYFWRWPGSDWERILFRWTDYFGTDPDPGDIENEIRANLAYTDDDGREWTYIRIGYGSSYSWLYGRAFDGWVCISDPDSSDIPAFNPSPDPILWSPDADPDWHGAAGAVPVPEKGSGSTYLIIIIAIGAAAVAAGVLLMRKKVA